MDLTERIATLESRLAEAAELLRQEHIIVTRIGCNEPDCDVCAFISEQTVPQMPPLQPKETPTEQS